jgi:hypothetical protein
MMYGGGGGGGMTGIGEGRDQSNGPNGCCSSGNGEPCRVIEGGADSGCFGGPSTGVRGSATMEIASTAGTRAGRSMNGPRVTGFLFIGSFDMT